MIKQYKIMIANTLTFIFAIMTILSLFSVNGFSLQTIIALSCAYFFGYITTCFYKVENMLRMIDYKSKTDKNSISIGKNEYNYVA